MVFLACFMQWISAQTEMHAAHVRCHPAAANSIEGREMIHELNTPLAHRVPEACRRLGIGRSALYELIKAGELRAIKIGKRTLIPETELQKIIAARLEMAA